jgi:4-alpha-glucanotransferase
MRFPRATGILLHPTSLPVRFGIGDLGPAAYEFVDTLAAAGQTYWQTLPLGPTGWGDSPYSAYSAFAGNTLLISPEKLVENGLLTGNDIANTPDTAADRVDYGAVIDWKRQMLAAAFERFQPDDKFAAFRREHSWWLDDYAAFRAIERSLGGKPWYEWPDELKLHDPAALDRKRSDLEREIDAERFAQFLFFGEWYDLKRYANERGIKIIGDIPLYVALDSSDVWCNREQFKLNNDGSPRVVAGVPPDYFSTTGQLWGNPIYDWERMRDEHFDWWTARFAFNMRLFDVVRLDHFIGFVRNWEVPGGDTHAADGEWHDVPGGDLFAVLKEKLGDLPVIVEDLGAMTGEVAALRDSLGFPGMKILQHGFNADSFNLDLPHNYPRNSVAYTGTHDNDTTVGWFKQASKHERSFCKKYLHSNGCEIHWDMIRALLGSVAGTAIIPMQDILGLGRDARMNLPATVGKNWQWRLKDGELNDDLIKRLQEMTETYGRAKPQ